MTLGRVVSAAPALQKITNMDLPVKSLYRVSILMAKIEPQLKFYDIERAKIIKKYCEKDTHGFRVVPKYREQLEREFNDLSEIDIGEIEEIKIAECDTILMSYADLVALEGIIKIDFER